MQTLQGHVANPEFKNATTGQLHQALKESEARLDVLHRSWNDTFYMNGEENLQRKIQEELRFRAGQL